MIGLDKLYARVAGSRRRWYERHPEARRRLTRPVISVGNLSVGGTGKTPLVVAIAEWLLAQGERPAILSRGYKRADRVDGAVVVSDGLRVLTTVSQAGDEPMMLARAVPQAVVCVSEDRHVAGAVAERRLGATVHLLDDGFQHVQLARDLDILVTSPGEIGAGRVLPFGRLREGKDAAARAHFVVVVGAGPDTARSEAWELGISAYSSARRALTIPGDVSPKLDPAIALAGIASPEQFFTTLREAGYRIEGTMAFPDHHRYTRTNLDEIASRLEAAGASVAVTTEKDFVRFEALQPLPFTMVAVPMRLQLDDWDALAATLTAALGRAREAA